MGAKLGEAIGAERWEYDGW